MKKSILAIMAAVAGAVIGAGAMGSKIVKEIEEKQKLSDKHLRLFKMMNQWVQIKQEGKSLADYFRENGYKTIAIYGMHYAGERLVDELKGTEIRVACGIDRNAYPIYSEIDIITKEDRIPDVDAVVVTAITFFDVIEEELSQIVDCPIVSLEDILYEV